MEDRIVFWILARRFGIAGAGSRSLSMELEFWIPIFSGIPHSLSRFPDTKDDIPDSTNKTTPYFGFHKENFPWFRDPNSFSLADHYRVIKRCISSLT